MTISLQHGCMKAHQLGSYTYEDVMIDLAVEELELVIVMLLIARR